MALVDVWPTNEYADIFEVGCPRALLYYRYAALWTTFFEELGRRVVLSPATDKAILTRGDALSVDECCLASKIYLGHVDSIIDHCDAVFVASMVGFGHMKGFCTKFQSLPDLVASTFHEQNIRIASLQVDEAIKKRPMRDSFVAFGQRFAVSKKQAQNAYRAALAAQQQADRVAAQEQEQRLLAPSKSPRILLAAHPYVAHDAFIGGGVADLLETLGATVLFADAVNHERSLLESFKFSQTLPWVINRELIGAILLLHERIDGIVLVSAFPCGPDSMTNDAIARCIQGKPILTLTVDGQSGLAGLETRIESFIDILNYQKQGGYLHV